MKARFLHIGINVFGGCANNDGGPVGEDKWAFKGMSGRWPDSAFSILSFDVMRHIPCLIPSP